MTFERRIAVLPLVMALTLPTAATARVLSQASIPCQPCADCTDDSGPRIVHVRMYNQTRLNESVLANIVEVTNRIWEPYGISIETGTRTDAITVVVSPGTMRDAVDGAPIAVGDTLFTEGHATPYIHLWLGGAESLARDSQSDGQPFTRRAPLERDAILLRMLGVALAHELGHYLLDTSRHSSAGLLRQTMAAREMEQPNPAHLRLSRKELQMMCQRPGTSVPQ
ncbi:MAG TPA: hypothetical protein VFT39_19000 [Vicinamibacterales bacterium]|nr:hypothetical protein [Vicinamibacterales bacterium]